MRRGDHASGIARVGAAPRVSARCRRVRIVGAGLFAIPMLTFACGTVAAGFNAAHTVAVILTCGIVLVAVDAVLLALLAVVAGVAAIRARRPRGQ